MERVLNIFNRKRLRAFWRRFRAQPEVKTASRPTLKDRSDYKLTWDQLASSKEAAYQKVAGPGYENDEALDLLGVATADELVRLLDIGPADTVLEIGCGVGRIGKILADKCRKWIGTDISGQMLRYAAQRMKGIDNYELVELNTVGLAEIPDETVDVIYCAVVFMHLFEWDRFKYVAESYRVLRPGGRCYFDNVDLRTDHGWSVFEIGLSFPINRRPAHLSMVSTGEELKTYALKAGFEQVQIHRWADMWVCVTGVKPENTVDLPG
jgi:ubiquinone/menaquinone biosynthesis C-methylase UbiE